MPLLHNQVNKLWYKPSYQKFKTHAFVQKIFTLDDAEDFIRTGAFLIKSAQKLSLESIPWVENRRYEILSKPRLENAYLTLGCEYLFKGVFLIKGYAINKVKPQVPKMQHPIQTEGKKRYLSKTEVQDIDYIVSHLPKIINFTDFNTQQTIKRNIKKTELRGIQIRGITRVSIPYPFAQDLLQYIHFKRNYALHRPFTIPEFNGIRTSIYELLEFITQQSTSRSLDLLSKLDYE